VISYSLQIDFDFGGYSNMAIGLALLCGFDFPKNFDYPYISQSITEFWRRWRLSLHPAGRQPAREVEDRPQSLHRVRAVRAVARRGLDLRGLGSLPRSPPGHREGWPSSRAASAADAGKLLERVRTIEPIDTMILMLQVGAASEFVPLVDGLAAGAPH
jgi:hypothetical protein